MEYFKYIVFFIILIFGIPVGCIIASKNQKFENLILFLALFFTCRLSETINFVSREHYRGTSRGFEVTLVDLASLILFFLVLHRKNIHKIKLLPPGSLLYFIYFIISLISITNSGCALYSWFEIWKMIRMYFYYWIIYNYIQDLKQIDLIIRYIGFIIIYIFLIVMQQKYLQGIWQCHGPFPHQNSLVMYLNIFGGIIFAAFLNKQHNFKEFFYYFLLFGMAAICILSTYSRGGLACFAMGAFIVLAFSLFSGLNPKKIGITILVFIMGVAVLYKSMDTIIKRFETAPKESADTRVEYANAARAMADDYTFGTGLNNFSLKMIKPYRYYQYRNKAAWELGGIVETAYLLVAAETGWLNLVIFLLFLFRFYFKNIANYFRYKKTEYAYITIGLSGGLTAIYAETTLEWVIKQTNNFYQLMLVFAIIAAMAKIYKNTKKDCVIPTAK
jgi:hypothetical protein